MRRLGTLKDGEDVVGQRVRVKVVKNKVAPPFRVAEFDMMHANGISVEGDIIDLAVAGKLIDKTGTWLRFGEVHLGQGREKARQFLKDNPAVADEIRQKVVGRYTQMPLQLAWAVTIHKSQGLTFDRVHVDLGRGAFSAGQTYVALSRCRTMEGMTLESPIGAGDVRCDPNVVAFMSTSAPAMHAAPSPGRIHA